MVSDLVASPNFLFIAMFMNPSSDVGGLGIECKHHRTSLVIESYEDDTVTKNGLYPCNNGE